MQKLISTAIVGILLVSSIGLIGLLNVQSTTVTSNTRLTVPSLSITSYQQHYIDLQLDNTNTYHMEPGKPVLPKIVQLLEVPFGASNVQVRVIPRQVQEQAIDALIRPAPALVPLSLHSDTGMVWPTMDPIVYGQTSYYPSEWYNVRVGCGLNKQSEHVTHVAVDFFPVRYAPALGRLAMAGQVDIRISYTPPASTPFSATNTYDLTIIAPQAFVNDLERLVEHKTNHGIATTLKTTENIYQEYDGDDEAEQIKYYIKDAIEDYGVRYVLLVGGLKSQFWSSPKDNENIGASGYHVPVRYTNLWDNPAFPLQQETIHDPGVICDLYYADIYKSGGGFEDWDPNDDGIYAAWNKPGVENDTGIDLYPDVALGRLACRSNREVQTVVDKIITYESSPRDDSWFNTMTVFSGDGFLDQVDLNIEWDTSDLPDGEYTIFAQSINDDDEEGPIDSINVTLDKSTQTNLNFNHDDHLNAALQAGYPAPPIAEICTVSEGDTLGNTDFSYEPGESEAYLNWFTHWGNMDYTDEVLTIRGKSYDPEPYGNLTSIHVWVENDDNQQVFSAWRNDTEMFYEGEWAVGDHVVQGRGGGLYYMPEEIEPNVLYTSNGRLNGQADVISAFNEGCGFMFMSGHGSPNSWGDHYPGVPGNRRYGSITGLVVTELRPWFPYLRFPVFPIDSLSNGEKLPVAVIGGCHNSQFNVSMVPSVFHALHLFFPFLPDNYMWTYGQPVPECFSWRMVRNPDGGAIASMGNTGLGYGVPGRDCTSGGGDAWITIEFFRQYGAEEQHILGGAYMQCQTAYVNTFDMTDLGAGHTKTVQQWALLGDPSLMIGGYE